MGTLVNMPLHLLGWALLLTLLLPGCGLYDRLTWKDQLDTRLNPRLGESKDEHIKRRGPPTKCTTLTTGEEVCEWGMAGVEQAGINCPPDTVYGGHQCQGGGASSWQHHLIFTYDQRGIAREWSYWGTLGTRTSKDSATIVQGHAGLANQKPQPNEPQAVSVQPVSVPKSPSNYSFFGVPLNLDTRDALHRAIGAKGATLIKRGKAPETDEYNSSQWIPGSMKVGVMYTQPGQLVGISVWYSAKSKEEATARANELRQRIQPDFGEPTKAITESDGWPIGYLWETNPIMAGVITEGRPPELYVALVLGLPEREAAMVKKPGYNWKLPY